MKLMLGDREIADVDAGTAQKLLALSADGAGAVLSLVLRPERERTEEVPLENSRLVRIDCVDRATATLEIRFTRRTEGPLEERRRF